MPDPIRADPHEEAGELLPWYATGQLDESDRALVERHLSSCATCRQQLKTERLLIDKIRSLRPEVDTSWSRLRAQIQQPETDRRSFGIFTNIWQMLSRPAVAALAVAQLAFVVVAGAVLLSLNRPGPTYQGLGASEAPRTANIIVIFRPDATEEEVREALRAARASLVGGPTAADAYLVHVPPNQRPTALTTLQSDENVQMAQPIDGTAQ